MDALAAHQRKILIAAGLFEDDLRQDAIPASAFGLLGLRSASSQPTNSS